MAGTVVGAAVVEISLDLAKFGSEAKSDLTKALGSNDLKNAVSKGLDDAASDVGKSGEKAGKSAADGMATGVKANAPAVKDAVAKSADDAGKSAESVFSRYGTSAASKFADAAKVALVGGGLAIAGGLAVLLKTGIGEQSDFLKGQAQLEAGIKSTGGASNVTAGHLEDLASSIQNYSGQTDDSIVGAEQLLLTFTGIKNVAGPMNDIFDQTVKVSADMAARMGGDASSSAIQLGKALNDPTQGITALTRVGVSFTEQQKAQIAALQQSGDTLGAQKIILGELNKEFGGSAKAAGETLPGQLARGRRAFEDISQSVLSALMPVLLRLGDLLTQYILPTFQRFVAWLITNWPQIQRVIVDSFQRYVMPVIRAVVDFFRNYLIPAVAAVVGFIVQHWPQIQQILVLFWQTVKPLLVAFGNYLLTLWHSIIEPLVNWVKAHWAEISTALKIAAIIIGVAFKVLAVVVTDALNVISAIIRFVAPLVAKYIQAMIDVVQVLAAVVMWFYTNVWKPQFDLIVAVVTTAKDWIVTAFTTVVDFFTGLPGRIASVAVTMFDAVKDAATTARDWVGDRVSDIVQFFVGLPGRIATFMSGAFESLKSEATGAVKGALNGVIQILNDAIGFINDKLISTANQVPFVNIPKIPAIPQLKAKGGWITGSGGPTSDSVPLMASPGEFVVKADAAARNKRVLETINAGGNVRDIGSARSRDERPIEIHEHIYQQPGQDPASLAADTSRRVARSVRAA